MMDNDNLYKTSRRSCTQKRHVEITNYLTPSIDFFSFSFLNINSLCYEIYLHIPSLYCENNACNEKKYHFEYNSSRLPEASMWSPQCHVTGRTALEVCAATPFKVFYAPPLFASLI